MWAGLAEALLQPAAAAAAPRVGSVGYVGFTRPARLRNALSRLSGPSAPRRPERSLLAMAAEETTTEGKGNGGGAEKVSVSRRELLRRSFALGSMAALAASCAPPKPSSAAAAEVSPSQGQNIASLPTRKARRNLRYAKEALERRKELRDGYPKGASAGMVVAGASLTSGMVAGSLATVALHPIDTIKTRLQRGSANISEAIGEGNLYKGVFSNILKEGPNAAIYMTIISGLQLSLMKLFPTAPALALFLAGGIGDFVGSVVRVPAEMLNKKLQTGICSSFGEAAQKTFMTEEGRQLTIDTWKVILLRDVPHGAFQALVYLGSHSYLLALLAALGHLSEDQIDFLGDATAGALAGAISSYVTTPADVLVTKFAILQNAQTDDQTDLAIAENQPVGAGSVGNPAIAAAKVPVERASPSMIQLGKEVVDEGGVGGFLVGGLQRMLYYAPMSAVFFVLYGTVYRAVFPALLPTLTNPLLYEVGPKLVDFVETGEARVVDISSRLLELAERATGLTG